MASRPNWIIWIAATLAAIVGTGFVVICAGYAFFWYAYLFLTRWPSDQQLVPSGYLLIPEAQQIDDLMPHVWHQVSNFQEPDLAEWQTEAFFSERYQLWMSVDVRVDRESGQITHLLGSPRFTLLEVGDVTVEHGSIGTSYRNQHQFDVADWKKVVAADGDFSVVGIDLKKRQPVLNFDKLVKSPRSGIQMR